MKNYPDERQYNDIIAEGDATGERLAADLRSVYAAAVPDMAFEYPTLATRASLAQRTFGRPWRPALGLGAAVAVAAAVLFAPGIDGGGSEVSAEEILERTSTAAGSYSSEGEQSYHFIVSTEINGVADASSSQETWFADPSHIRTTSTWSGPDGVSSEFGQIVNGDEAWIYQTGEFGGAAHGPTNVLGQTLGVVEGQTSLADVLAQYNNGSCQSAQLSGEDTMVGRSAYVITVGLDVSACPEGMRDDPRLLEGKSMNLTLWVDQETFLALRTEQRDVDGTVQYVYAVTEIQVGEDIPASTFVFTPPEGVTVTEVETLTDAKNAISGGNRIFSGEESGTLEAPAPDMKVEPAR